MADPKHRGNPMLTTIQCEEKKKYCLNNAMDQQQKTSTVCANNWNNCNSLCCTDVIQRPSRAAMTRNATFVYEGPLRWYTEVEEELATWTLRRF